MSDYYRKVLTEEDKAEGRKMWKIMPENMRMEILSAIDYINNYEKDTFTTVDGIYQRVVDSQNNISYKKKII